MAKYVVTETLTRSKIVQSPHGHEGALGDAFKTNVIEPWSPVEAEYSVKYVGE